MVYHGKKSYGRLNFNDVEKEILIKKKKKEKNNRNHTIYIYRIHVILLIKFIN